MSNACTKGGARAGSFSELQYEKLQRVPQFSGIFAHGRLFSPHLSTVEPAFSSPVTQHHIPACSYDFLSPLLAPPLREPMTDSFFLRSLYLFKFI